MRVVAAAKAGDAVSTYEPVKKAMAAGTPLELICASCPWDRLCVQPPAMSAADIDEYIEKAKAEDEARDPSGKNVGMGTLMTTLMFAGKDSSGQMCPVFSARLKSPEGREIADAIRKTMRHLGEVA